MSRALSARDARQVEDLRPKSIADLLALCDRNAVEHERAHPVEEMPRAPTRIAIVSTPATSPYVKIARELLAETSPEQPGWQRLVLAGSYDTDPEIAMLVKALKRGEQMARINAEARAENEAAGGGE